MSDQLRQELEDAGCTLRPASPLPEAGPATPTSQKRRELPPIVAEYLESVFDCGGAYERGEKGEADKAEAIKAGVMVIREGIPALVNGARDANDILEESARALRHVRRLREIIPDDNDDAVVVLDALSGALGKIVMYANRSLGVGS